MNDPTPLGKSVDLQMMVYSDQTGDNTTRRFCTIFIIFVKLYLITWISKKQLTVESALFGSKLFSTKHRVEKI